jgi:hypothetical protein
MGKTLGLNSIVTRGTAMGEQDNPFVIFEDLTLENSRGWVARHFEIMLSAIILPDEARTEPASRQKRQETSRLDVFARHTTSPSRPPWLLSLFLIAS